MHKDNTVERLLYEFSIILEKENDLRHLYFVSLPVIMMAFNVEKCVIFKYSRRKECFDPKAGLTQSDIKKLKEKWENSHLMGEFADYLLNMDVNELYETEFNIKMRGLNIPCNDISRSIINPFIVKDEKTVNIDNIKNKYIARVLIDMDMRDILYLPLIARNITMGFMLISPPINDMENLKKFSVGLSLLMNIFINDKELDAFKLYIDKNKEDIEHKRRLYEIGETASTITHEIKNALVGIIGLFNKLKKDIEPSEKSKNYIKIIENELDRIYKFVLDINKYSSSYVSHNKEIADLKEIIDRAIDMTYNINNKFVFSVCVDDKVRHIYVDKSELEQVLINLFKNSMEAHRGDSAGKISIRARKDKNFVVLKIRDNSGGVKEKELDEITKPFYTTKSHGTGLGLSIVKEIIKKHDGSIEFKNINNGLECTIKLALPRKN